jgi:hypothetical protein
MLCGICNFAIKQLSARARSLFRQIGINAVCHTQYKASLFFDRSCASSCWFLTHHVYGIPTNKMLQYYKWEANEAKAWSFKDVDYS